MSSQWIWRIIYMIFIGAITVLVATFSQASKVVNFLKDNEDLLMSDDRAMISATVIANNRDGTDVYVLSNPLYSETFENNNMKASISIYPLVEFKNDKANNSIAILIKDLEISDVTAFRNDDDYHIIHADITFDRDLTINNKNIRSFNEFMVPLFDNTGRIIVIKEDLLKTPTGQAEFLYITFSYQVGDQLSQTFVSLANSSLSTTIPSDLFDETFNRDILEVTASNMDILKTYGLESFHQNTDIYYNAQLILEFNRYNVYYIRYIGIELLIVLPLTYLFFFHKHVKRMIRQRKYNTQINKESKTL